MQIVTYLSQTAMIITVMWSVGNIFASMLHYTVLRSVTLLSIIRINERNQFILKLKTLLYEGANGMKQ
jgi:hypothetical protein